MTVEGEGGCVGVERVEIRMLPSSASPPTTPNHDQQQHHTTPSDLLDILSKGSNPQLILRHLPKNFDNVHNLSFRKDEAGAPTRAATGMYSGEVRRPALLRVVLPWPAFIAPSSSFACFLWTAPHTKQRSPTTTAPPSNNNNHHQHHHHHHHHHYHHHHQPTKRASTSSLPPTASARAPSRRGCRASSTR